MEIERKFLVSSYPDLTNYPYHLLEQAYLCTDPVIRIRREDESFFLTYKGKGLMVREEYNLPLSKEAYCHLLPKADGIIIRKKRYFIPYHSYTIELDLFALPYEHLILAEVEFSSQEEALAFQPPEWFLEDVTYDGRYQNSKLSQGIIPWKKP